MEPTKFRILEYKDETLRKSGWYPILFESVPGKYALGMSSQPVFYDMVFGLDSLREHHPHLDFSEIKETIVIVKVVKTKTPEES